MYCTGCNHDLTGVTDDRCPNCGRSFVPETGRHRKLCPNCCYNLTGLSDGRCPECGDFSPADEIEQVWAARRIDLSRALLHWLWPATVLSLTPMVIAIHEQAGILLLYLTMFFVAGYSLFNCFWIARRIEYTRQLGMEQPAKPSLLIVGAIGGGLYVVQALIGIFGCGVCLAVGAA